MRGALQAILDVCMRFMAQTVLPWKLVIGHLGDFDDTQLSGE